MFVCSHKQETLFDENKELGAIAVFRIPSVCVDILYREEVQMAVRERVPLHLRGR